MKDQFTLACQSGDYPLRVVLAVKRYNQSTRRSEVLGFPRSEQERQVMLQLHGLFQADRVHAFG
jgi:hypothetical protein